MAGDDKGGEGGEDGKDEFYRGGMATKMVDELRGLGGTITRKDMVQYTPTWAPALSVPLVRSVILATM